MQDLPGGHCKVSMRIRAKDRSIVSKLKLGLLGWVPKKQWQAHYRVLARLLQEDISKANSAIELAA